jgi:hypothetical protein
MRPNPFNVHARTFARDAGSPQLTERPKSLLMRYDVTSTPSPNAFGVGISSTRCREAFRARGESRRDPKPDAASVFNLLGASAASIYDLLCRAVW